MSKNLKVVRCLRLGTSAIVLLAAVGWTGAGTSHFTYFESTAFAQSGASQLTSDQIAAIQSAVKTAIANVDPSLTGDAKTQAISQAIAQATTSAIATYGQGAVSAVASAAISAGLPAAQVVAAIIPAADSAGVPTATTVADVVLGAVSAGASPTLVAEAVIATATQLQLASNDVGTGLGKAAAQISQGNSGNALQIAQVVSNEGTTQVQQSFATSVAANGGSQQLADAGTQNPVVTGATNAGNGNFGNGNNGNNNSGTGGTTIPPCSSPSCT